jgi:hypothetical protein
MKLRIWRNAVRLRLTISEVERLSAGEAISATLDVLPVRFTCELKAEQTGSMAVGFDGASLTIKIPFDDAQALAGSDRVGVRASVSSPVQVLIEKDFGCAKPRPGEDLSDLYGYTAAL